MDPSYNGNFNGANPGGMNPGGFPGNNMPISSGTGDVVLSGGQKKQGKKSFIVLIVLAVILVVVGVVFVVFNPLSPASLNGQSGGQLSAYQAFARYSNYYMYGNDDVEVNNEATDNDSQTFFSSIMASEDFDARKNYLTNLRNYYEEFHNTFIQGTEIEDSVSNLLSDYGKKVKVATYYYSGVDLDRQTLVEVYTEKGSQGVIELIATTFAPYESVGELYGKNYYDLVTKYAYTEEKLIEVYDSFGCIRDGDIDYMCSSRKANEESARLNDELSDVYSDLRSIRKNSLADLNSTIPEIRSLLDQKDNNSGQEEDDA